MDSKIGFEMNLIVVKVIRGRCASFIVLTATVSEIFGGQTTPSSSIDSLCKRRLTWSTKRVNSTNQKRFLANAHAHRDVFQARLP